MGGSFTAEVFKLRKRPATWVLALIFVVAVALFGYLFTYIFVINAPGDAAPPPQIANSLLQFLLPENVLVNVLSNGFSGFGVALALILGALAVGSEYGWETFKVTSTQRPGRLSLIFGKLLAVSVILLLFTLLVIAAGAASSYVVASLKDAPVNWPAAGEFLKAIGAGWLMLGVFAAMGIFLATLFRGTALAIGLGLVYLLVLESIFLGLAPQSDTVKNIGKALPGKNTSDLANAFGNVPQGFGPPGGATEDPTRAVLVLGAYLIVFVVLSALIFRQRDVT